MRCTSDEAIGGAGDDDSCVHTGRGSDVGTPINIHTAARLEQALIADPGGQALILKIGADDAEQRREFARLNLLMSPPTRKQRVCGPGPTGWPACYDHDVIDQDEYNHELQAINAGRAN